MRTISIILILSLMRSHSFASDSQEMRTPEDCGDNTQCLIAVTGHTGAYIPNKTEFKEKLQEVQACKTAECFADLQSYIDEIKPDLEQRKKDNDTSQRGPEVLVLGGLIIAVGMLSMITLKQVNDTGYRLATDQRRSLDDLTEILRRTKRDSFGRLTFSNDEDLEKTRAALIEVLGVLRTVIPQLKASAAVLDTLNKVNNKKPCDNCSADGVRDSSSVDGDTRDRSRTEGCNSLEADCCKPFLDKFGNRISKKGNGAWLVHEVKNGKVTPNIECCFEWDYGHKDEVEIYRPGGKKDKEHLGSRKCTDSESDDPCQYSENAGSHARPDKSGRHRARENRCYDFNDYQPTKRFLR